MQMFDFKQYRRISVNKLTKINSIFGSIIVSVMIIFSTLTTAFAATEIIGTQYKFSDISLTVVVPSELACLTRSTTNNNSYVSKVGADDVAPLQSLMRTNNVYLEAVPDDVSYEIAISGKKVSADKLKNFTDMSDEELEEVYNQYVETCTNIDNNNIEETVTASKIETINDQPYFVIDVTSISSKKVTVYVKKYYTVSQGIAYTYQLQSNGNEINDGMSSNLEFIVNSAKYQKVKKSIWENGTFTELLSSIITIAAPIALLAIIFYFLNRAARKSKSKMTSEEAKLRAEYKKEHESSSDKDSASKKDNNPKDNN